MHLIFGRATFDHIWQAARERDSMTDREPFTEADIDRIYTLVHDLGRKVDDLQKQLAALATTTSRLEQRHDKWLHNITECLNENAEWSEAVLSNLYDDPIPGPTEAEWDEAHRINASTSLYDYMVGIGKWQDINIAAADTFMGIFDYHRPKMQPAEQAFWGCDCCRKGVN